MVGKKMFRTLYCKMHLQFTYEMWFVVVALKYCWKCFFQFFCYFDFLERYQNVMFIFLYIRNWVNETRYLNTHVS